MSLQFTEEKLRKWYKETVPEELHQYDDVFVEQMVKKASSLEPSEDGYSLDEETESCSYKDEIVQFVNGYYAPAAEAIIGHKVFYIEKISLDLLGQVLCAGGLDLLIGEPASITTVFANAIVFAFKLGQYSKELSGIEVVFYKYVVSNCYSYFDRMDGIFKLKDEGFSLDDAVESFLADHEKNKLDDTVFSREKVSEAARSLVQKEVFIKIENENYAVQF